MNIESLSIDELLLQVSSISGPSLLKQWIQAQQNPEQLQKLLQKARDGETHLRFQLHETIRTRSIIRAVIRWGRLDTDMIDYVLDNHPIPGETLAENAQLTQKQRTHIVQHIIQQTDQANQSDVMELQNLFRTAKGLIENGHALSPQSRQKLLDWVQHPRAGAFHIHAKLKDVVFMEQIHRIRASGGALFLTSDPDTPHQDILVVAQNAGISNYTFWAIGSHPQADAEILATLYDRIREGTGQHGRENAQTWFTQLQKLTRRLQKREDHDMTPEEIFQLQLARERAKPETDGLVELVQKHSGTFQTRAFLALVKKDPERGLQVAVEMEGIDSDAVAQALNKEDPKTREALIRATGNLDTSTPTR